MVTKEQGEPYSSIFVSEKTRHIAKVAAAKENLTMKEWIHRAVCKAAGVKEVKK